MNKDTGFRLATLLKKSFAKLSRTPSLQNNSGGLLLRECAKSRESHVIMGRVDLLSLCHRAFVVGLKFILVDFMGSKFLLVGILRFRNFFLLGILWIRNFFSWVIPGCKNFSVGYFVGL